MKDLLTTTARSTERFLSEIAARPPLRLDILDRTGRSPYGRNARWQVWDGAKWLDQPIRETSTEVPLDVIDIDYAALEARVLATHGYVSTMLRRKGF